MARKTVIICDLDADHEATANIALALNGKAVELDVCDEDAKKIVDTMDELMKPGRWMNVRDLVRRPTATTIGESGSTNSQVVDMEPAKIRQWAEQKGIPLAAKGKIPSNIEEQYKAEMQAAAEEAEDK